MRRPSAAAQLFQALTCAMCHTVQGTLAQGKHRARPDAPGQPPHLAAGTLPNTPQHLASWIADPQKHKPGHQHAGHADVPRTTCKAWSPTWGP
jgi:cytochrome c oxidase subunit 2